MKLFNSVSFDFKHNWVKLGSKWFSGLQIKQKESVRLVRETIIPMRSEKIVAVIC